MRPIGILRALLPVLLLCGAGTASALTFLDTSFGTPVGAASPRALAMGSTGVSLHQGSNALFFNPATLVPEEGRVEFDLSVGLLQANEDRLVPLWDSFQSYVDDTIVALNRNVYADASGGIVWRLPLATPMALGAGIFPRYDFEYDYFEEFRDPNSQSQPRDRILQNREIDQSGRLWSVSFGYGAEILSRVRLGLAAHGYTGELERAIRVEDFQQGTTSADLTTQDLGGWGWTVGAWGRVNERLDLGIGFEAPFELDGAREVTQVRTVSGGESTTVVAANESVKYPGTLRFGFTYHPRNRLRTTFVVEAERRFWEGLDTPVVGALGDTLSVDDTWDLRVGLEHVFYNALPVRFGFRYLQNYADPESERSIYSAGLGYRAAGFDFDLTGMLSRQTSRQDFLFDPSYLSYQAPGSLEKVEDSVFQLLFGLSRTF